MKSARVTIFAVCILTVTASAYLKGCQYFSKSHNQLSEVIFCALIFLVGIGLLGFIMQFFAKRTAQVLFSVFYGFLAGIMATNFISEMVSGTTYSSTSVYFISYGLMLLFFALAVVGLVLCQIPSPNALQNPPPNIC